MHFDVFTALTASSSVVLLLSGVFAFFWHRHANSPWLRYWALAYLAIGIGNALTIFSPVSPRPLGFAAGTAVFFIGFGLIWQGTRAFEGRKPRWGALAVAVFGLPWLFALPDVQSHPPLRVGLMSAIMAAGLALAAWETWRGRGEGLPSKLPLAAMLAVAAATVLARAPFGAAAAFPIGARKADDIVVIVLIGGLVVLAIILAMLVLSVTLERAEKSQRDLAALDPMTALLNRRGIEAVFADGKLPAGDALILFDLDRFKQVNDTFGHAAGDVLIRAFALICREELRQVDHASRFGGEEFALVLARTDARTAVKLAERVRDRYGRLVVEIDGGAVVGTVSGGVFAAPPDEPVWFTAAVAAADRALYQAKAAGRNRIVSAERGATPVTSRDFDERCIALEARAASA